MAKETPEEKAESLDRQFEESQARADARPQGRPAQLPTNPQTGSDDAADGRGGTG